MSEAANQQVPDEHSDEYNERYQLKSESYYTIEQIAETARALYKKSGLTQEEIAELVADNRGPNAHVTQPSVALALDGKRRYAALMCDIIELLATFALEIEREEPGRQGSRPVHYIKWNT
ncbi:hypothetical protein [Salisaeta icosahedral phage 1]|uniref:hypothetical protein n=1 Tax=Salisaeta icosahedral phage 1 TaxID=1183239 RepID=UPI00025EA921|nr:hypothetical protein A322_gp20 [Salisaeta icosahedral phage 1]AFJ21475.1 hypothetical protein [Salisaeta icosahedral phage 1]